jgi:deoxycytidine triphosphate deaminase
MLSDADLRTAFEAGELKISRPRNEVTLDEFRGCSIDLHLAAAFYRCRRPRIPFRRRKLDLSRLNQTDMPKAFRLEEARQDKGLHLDPHGMVLARTEEYIELGPSLAGILTGRSGYARLGLAVEVSQNLLQPGHSNSVPLQIVNHTPYTYTLYPGTPICQLVVSRLGSEALIPYNSDPQAKYKHTTEFLSQAYRDDTIPIEQGGSLPG